jgi:predicted transposase YbfD/YdcC
VNLKEFRILTTVTYNFSAEEVPSFWFAADGKELRGSILTGSKRGDCIVQVVRQENREVVGQLFYNGKKESEVPAVKKLLEETKVSTQKVSLDALHLKPNTLQLINRAAGKYLVGLKGNQKKLLATMKQSLWKLPQIHDASTYEKGHGRYEQRIYSCYDVSTVSVDPRWEAVNFQTLIRVHRKRKILKCNKKTEEVAYYLSNVSTQNTATAQDLFNAVRQHWQIEVNNNCRDTILNEDKLRTSNCLVTKTVACCRTVAINLLNAMNSKNRAAQLDLFADKFHTCLNVASEFKIL